MKNEYCLPNKKEMLPRVFFARHAEKVAKDLLGRFFVVERPDKNPLYACLYEVAAYEGGAAGSMSKGSLYAPGTLSISTKFGKRLIDIATLEICRPSCVTLISGVVGDGYHKPEFVEGPGKLAAKLGINPDFDGLPVDIDQVWLAGESAEPEEIKKRSIKKATLNCKGFFYIK